MEDRTSGLARPACRYCPAYQLAICHARTVASDARVRGGVEQSVRSIAARRTMFRERDLHDIVPIVCNGWVSRDVGVSGGGRMILSFYLPGQLIGDTLFAESAVDSFVEAITDVEYRVFKRSTVREFMFICDESLEMVLRGLIEEMRRYDQLIVDLGRHSAEVRVARLILRLVERLKARELEKSDAHRLRFPLRHHHIGDATGLTSVHVTKVLSKFRHEHVLALGSRTLSLLDPAALNRIAGW